MIGISDHRQKRNPVNRLDRVLMILQCQHGKVTVQSNNDEHTRYKSIQRMRMWSIGVEGMVVYGRNETMKWRWIGRWGSTVS